MKKNKIKIILVQNFLSSGTTLLHSIFDNHYEIFQLPGLRARNLVVFWEKNSLLDKDEFINKFIKEFIQWFVSNDDEIGFDDKLDEKKFREYLDIYLINNKDFSNFLISIYKSYYKTKNNKINFDNIKVLVYPIHSLNKKYHKIFFNHFSDIVYIFMIRNPFALFQSGINHLWHIMAERKKKFFINSHIIQLISQFFLDLNLRRSISKNYSLSIPLNLKADSLIIKLEDIHLNTKKTINTISKKLEIQITDTLFQTTFAGKNWKNRKESVNVSGIGGHNVKDNFDKIEIIFQLLIQKKFENYIKKFQYKKIVSDRNNLIFDLFFKISELERNSIKCYLLQFTYAKKSNFFIKNILKTILNFSIKLFLPIFIILQFIILRIFFIYILLRKPI